MDNEQIKYFGFWPAPANHFEPETLEINDDGFVKSKTRNLLLSKILEVEGKGWKFAVTGDYLCLLHLTNTEKRLAFEKDHNKEADIVDLSLSVSKAAKFEYSECLNAISFLVFCACFTGRGLQTLHDYSELSTWSCGRFRYDTDGTALGETMFLRPPEQQLRRLGLLVVEKPTDRFAIDKNIFRDAAQYWSVIYDQKLVSTAAVGSKILSEHRRENFRACAALAWFEIEKWLVPYASNLGLDVFQYRSGAIRIDQFTGEPMYKNISTIISDFLPGTWINANSVKLLELCRLRNRIAHKGYTPNREESGMALDIFVRAFNFRTGLHLNVDTHAIPTQSVS